MAHYRQQSEWTAEQTLSYVTGLEVADEQSDYEAFATAYNYFMNLLKKKISWSVHLEKLLYVFIDLAFDNNKHSSIKDVFKSYRSLTQGQYSQSLKDVLEHYRDRKLQAILEEDILHENIELIVNLPNIQNEEASSTVIFSSFKPQEKKKLQELKHKLKIVWEGYKYIIETVRINQKLEDVFKATLMKIFAFVDKYNRKHQFKSFCKTLRSGLNPVFNKRDKTQQQRAIYIDLQKSDVNDRHIDIRLEQFKVTIRLGLWQEGFQVLQDIYHLMKLRKGATKGNIMYRYYQNLALLFQKSNYWHYHAFAYYNFFLYAQKNPKLSQKERIQLSDKLLLSVLCIPPVTLQSNQSKDSQQKISTMMNSFTKIPSKTELFDMIVSAGIAQKASVQIKNLWSFMFLEFDLESLQKGLQLLGKISNQNYLEFKVLIEDILIYRQLQSISEIYQRIKIESLLSLIPLPRQRIEKILLSSYHQKILDFVLDEDQKIIIFEDKSTEKFSNPTQNFFSVYIDLAIQKQKQRQDDSKHIVKQFETFISESEDYYWKIRQYKIDQYRKKLKKPQQELRNEAHKRRQQQKQQRQRQQQQKLARQAEAQRQAEEKKKQFGNKKIIINDIKDIKQNRVVRILGKKIEQLTDDQIENISIETLNTHLQEIKVKIQNNKQARFKKAFNQVDYLQRERRQKLDKDIKALVLSKEEEQKKMQGIKNDSKKHFEEQNAVRHRISTIMNYLKPKIEDETIKLEERYENEMGDFKQKLIDYYKQKIIARAKALAQQNRKKKQAEEVKMRQAQSSFQGFMWTFSGVARVTDSTAPSAPQNSQTSQVSEKKFNNYAPVKLQFGTNLGKQSKQEEKKDDKKQQPKGWGFAKPTKQQPKPTVSTGFTPVPPTQKKTFGQGLGFNKKPEQQKKKEEPRKPKKYVDVN